MIAIIIIASSCKGTVIFALWFPVVLRVYFRISLNRNNCFRCLRCIRRESSRKRRSQQFLRRAIILHPAVPPLSPSDLCRSIRRLTKQVVTPLRERLTRACRYLLAALSRLVKGATFISLVWSQSSKSSTFVSLSYPVNLVVKTPSRVHIIQKSLLF